jgi:hypothetical protein
MNTDDAVIYMPCRSGEAKPSGLGAPSPLPDAAIPGTAPRMLNALMSNGSVLLIGLEAFIPPASPRRPDTACPM